MQPRLSRRRARSITSPHEWKAKKQKENAINAKTRFLSRTAAVKQWLCLHAHKTRNYRPQDGEPREALSCEMMMQPFTKNLARSKKQRRPASCRRVRKLHEGNGKASSQLCASSKIFCFACCRARWFQLKKNPFTEISSPKPTLKKNAYLYLSCI